jgi:DNA-binding MarR family transcriptional regulator
VVQAGPGYSGEFPDGDPACTELFGTLSRTGEALWDELERCITASFDVPSLNAANTLAVIEGASQPLTPTEIGDRLYKSSATITTTLDALERRGWIRRIPNPGDRRSVLIEVTEDGRGVIDQMLPGVRKIELAVLADLTPAERTQLLELLGKVLTAAARTANQPPIPLNGRRNRPARLQ